MPSETPATFTRQQFLRGFWQNLAAEVQSVSQSLQGDATRILLPPGSQSWQHLLATCTQCYKCISVCPHEALRVVREDADHREGYPAIYPLLSACQNCPDMPCIEACENGTLSYANRHNSSQTLVVDPALCLNGQGHFCMSCVNQCPVGESALKLDENGLPEWNTAACTACGICIQACPAPTNAIKIQLEEAPCPSPAS